VLSVTDLHSLVDHGVEPGDGARLDGFDCSRELIIPQGRAANAALARRQWGPRHLADAEPAAETGNANCRLPANHLATRQAAPASDGSIYLQDVPPLSAAARAAEQNDLAAQRAGPAGKWYCVLNSIDGDRDAGVARPERPLAIQLMDIYDQSHVFTLGCYFTTLVLQRALARLLAYLSGMEPLPHIFSVRLVGQRWVIEAPGRGPCRRPPIERRELHPTHHHHYHGSVRPQDAHPSWEGAQGERNEHLANLPKRRRISRP
jgi:hypothetical protein